ncbi:MAG: AAA family ATPase, partial [Deltaproteobacteria bacterium]|jgi:hypothetical protein|nr:AAA family ATPase [Deltaproteobacteria bacterium]
LLDKLKAELLREWRVELAGPEEPEEPEEPAPAPQDSAQHSAQDSASDDKHQAGQDELDADGPDGPDGTKADGSADSASGGQAQGAGELSAGSSEPSSEANPAESSAAPDAAGGGPSGQPDQPDQPDQADQTDQAGRPDGPDEEAGPPPPPPERLASAELAERELPEQAPALIARLRQRLEALGEVNHGAVEEEAELLSRFEFQKTSRDDLTKAIDDLEAGINLINQTCRRRFSETFNEADKKFREIFPVLFEGGQGWLALTDQGDPLESGVEIHVHPQGKRIMVMSLLSGGEKALTALCLIFALYLIKPSPFCLLDEADAPLDEANIDRFNNLLRNLSQASQIIMVTHNKRTMQISDALYGVTMETPGVSRLVTVNLAEAEVLTNV